jgi:hypothetical protein
MKENRLEGVRDRNRKHLLLDLALAALFVVALLVSGAAFGAELPKLSLAARTAPSAEITAGVEAAPQLASR